MKRRPDKPMTGRDFDKLSDAEKEAIYLECEKIGPGDGVPLTRQQKAQHARFLRKAAGSAKKDAQRVQVSLERALVKAADRFAAEHGLSRSQLIEQGIRLLIAGSAA
jgi:hypothetical protein